ncbi:MAG TPA: Na/Pi cotransporter family protein, partial [bacterium]|nr:Na/Pi cotransporter family protein [bacterium]
MDWKTIAFEVFGGLGLFLLGMKIMSEGMQKVAGDRLRKVLGFLTQNRFMAILVGMTVTAVIQSSSATTVMTVGFVNAQLRTLTQAIGVILGANIGTTVTGWLVSLAVVKYAMVIIGIGVLLRFAGHNETVRYSGEAISGLGLLFLGMTTMSDGLAPLRDSPGFVHFFTMVDGVTYPSILLGDCRGTVTNIAVQSSSATIGIAIALATQGLLTITGAVSLILGDNIGTTITALLASIGTNHHAKRAAFAHTMFNVFGVVIILIIFFPFVALVNTFIPQDADLTIRTAEEAARYGMAIGAKPFIGPHVAMAHTMFNVTNVIFFTPLIGFLAFMVRKIVPEPKAKPSKGVRQFVHIHYGLVETPALGILESEKELYAMAERVKKNSKRIRDILGGKREAGTAAEKIEKNEELIDEYRMAITEFLLSLAQRSLSREDAAKVGNYITCAHNLEKYADYVTNMTRAYLKMKSDNLILSDAARTSLYDIVSDIEEFYEATIVPLSGVEVDAKNFLATATTRKREIKERVRAAKMGHFERLQAGTCKGEASMAYVDILDNIDGMVSQVHNIAETLTLSKFSGTSA